VKFSVTNDRNVLAFTAAENCDSDSWPFLSQVVFRRYQASFDPEIGSVAASLLFSSHCGSVAEFDVKLGTDAAKTIRRICPAIEEILPIDGLKRDISQGSKSIVVVEAADTHTKAAVAGRSARAVTWSGDSVPAGDRDSSRYVCGEIFTNAELVAGKTETSVALALLLGGRSLRDIYVAPPAESEQTAFGRIADGLDCMGIKVRAL
jgi:hypothetical protein